MTPCLQSGCLQAELTPDNRLQNHRSAAGRPRAREGRADPQGMIASSAAGTTAGNRRAACPPRRDGMPWSGLAAGPRRCIRVHVWSERT
jgi:hypothetical protein